MPDTLTALEPALLWRRFDELSAIPRPSGHEEQAAAWVVDWAAERGFDTRRDRVGNVVVSVPARAGLEDAPAVALQAHLDMVCERHGHVTHDFATDPIRTRVDGEWVRADGTTLGADNGIGVAAAMAAAEDESLRRGPLELVFTIDEERGLSGAAGLDGDLVSARMLLNLDGEEDGVLYVGCAGGADTLTRLPVRRAPGGGPVALELRVGGLRGGHSGMEIHLGRANAVRVLARILDAGRAAGLDAGLVELGGGAMRNAIPREAVALLRAAEGDEARWREVAERIATAARDEAGDADDGLTVEVRTGSGGGDRVPLSAEDRDRAVRLVLALPHGPSALSREVPGLVETSACLAVVETHDDALAVCVSVRSSVDAALRAQCERIGALAALAGASCRIEDGYPGWRPDPDSRLARVVAETCEGVWGRPPEVTAIHAGLECGLLGRRVPGIDMVSFGPTIRGAHSPDERVHVPSVARFWEALGASLERLASARPGA